MRTKKENELIELINNNSYYSIIYSMISNIIEPINLPEELEDDFDYFLIHSIIRNSGFIVKGKDDKFHYCYGALAEPWDDFGYGKNFIAHNYKGDEFKGELDVDGCLIRPFTSRMPISIFNKVTSQLSSLDMSTDFLIKWARVAPFLIGNDNKQKQALIDVVKSVMDGNMTPIISDNILSSLMDEKTSPVTVVDVMQPERVRDFQYLVEYRKSIIKECMELFGIPYQIGGKMAQMSVDEVNGTNGSCYIIPMDILKNFRKFARHLNKTFGLNVDFKLNVLILSELEKYFNQEGENHATGENIRDELTGAEPTDSEHSGSDGGNDGDGGED